MNDGRPCGDCGVLPGQLHVPGCDVERCPDCGGQFIFCDCEDRHEEPVSPRIPWSGVWPGAAEAREFGWWCRRNPRGPGYVPCSADHPDAVEDLTRVATEGVWDREAQRFVRTT